MLARQREAGQFMVEKHLFFPAIDIVATAAIGPEPRFMCIIISMAANTCRRRQFHMRRFFVTRFAQHWFVRTLQRETGHRVMVELGDLPVLAVVAFGAFGAVATFMLVVLLVTADAGHRRIFDRIIRAVAARAGGCHMCADQLEPGILIVIEIDRFPG